MKIEYLEEVEALKVELKNIPVNMGCIMKELNRNETIFVLTMSGCMNNDKNKKFSYSPKYGGDVLANCEKFKNEDLSTITEIVTVGIACLDNHNICLNNFPKANRSINSDYEKIIKASISKLISDELYPLMCTDYMYDETGRDIDVFEAIEKYLTDNRNRISVAFLTLLYYVNSNPDKFENNWDRLNSVILKAYDTYLEQAERKYSAQGNRNLVYENYISELQDEIDELDERARKLQEKLNEVSGKNDFNQKILEKLRSENEKLKSELNEQKKVKNTDSKTEEYIKLIINEINKSNEKSKANYSQALKEAKEFKCDVLENSYKGFVNGLNSQVAELKAQLKEYKDKNKQLINEIDNLNDELFEVNNKLNNCNNTLDTEDNNDAFEPTEKVVPVEEFQPLYYMGYCEITNDKHYIVLPSGEKKELFNLPEKIYLTDGQFVRVDTEFNVSHVYSHYKKEDISGLKLGFIRVFPNETVVFVEGRKANVDISTIKSVRNNQVIGVDDNYNIRVLFKSVKAGLDNYYKSIMIKKHKLFFVLKPLMNGFMVRDIFENTETFLPKSDDWDSQLQIDIGDIIVFNESNSLINVIKFSRFYTMSSLYEKSRIAIIKVVDNEYYCKIQDSLETFKVKQPIYDIRDGDLVVVDEFMNILYQVDNESEFINITEAKKKRNEERKRSNIAIDITKEVLIIGNISYENSYKLNFLKKGYKVEVVDGFLPYNKISPYFKDKECIIVVSSFISHDNMWRIKEESLPVIYPVSDGASRLLDEFEEFLRSKQDN